jgi:hypothetical protein
MLLIKMQETPAAVSVVPFSGTQNEVSARQMDMYKLTTLLCIHKYTLEFTRKFLVTETEHHRKQPVHTRLLH